MARRVGFSEDAAADIERRYCRGEMSPAIATDYGVTPKAIIDLLRRRHVSIRPRGRRLPGRGSFTLETNGTAYIQLGNGQVALVDAADASWLDQWTWYVMRPAVGQPRRYVAAGIAIKGRKTTLFMHRLILNLPFGDVRQGDHINHDGLDNRRCNLRIVSQKENIGSRRPRKMWRKGRGDGCVYYDASSRALKPWRAQAQRAHVRYRLGRFKTRDEALAKIAEWRQAYCEVDKSPPCAS